MPDLIVEHLDDEPKLIRPETPPPPPKLLSRAPETVARAMQDHETAIGKHMLDWSVWEFAAFQKKFGR